MHRQADEHRPLLLLILLTVAIVALAMSAGCTSATTKKLIVSANEAQDAAARTYDDAKKAEDVAIGSCRTALLAASKPFPATADQIQPFCAAVGVQIPYDPVKLQRAAGPINALYDGVRSADNVRRNAGTQDISQQIATQLAVLFAQVVADLTDAGIPVPQSLKDAAPLLMNGGK